MTKDYQRMLATVGVALLAGPLFWQIIRHPKRAAEIDAAQASQRCPMPPLPEAARQAGEHGWCQVHVVFGEFGAPDSVKVLQSTGYPDLDGYTLDFVRQHWRGEPGTWANMTTVYDNPGLGASRP